MSTSPGRSWSSSLFLAVVVLWLVPALPVVSPADDAPVVIVLSWDGVRHDYPDRSALPGLERMARSGARASRLIPVFPASTFPNHVSMATGTYSDRHGIVENEFYDRERDRQYSYEKGADWIQAEPIWCAAERQGVRAATYFWVGSETDWQGLGASYRVTPFDKGIGEEAKLDQILAWLDLPPARRPGLIMSWWPGADTTGHRRGPDAPQIVDDMRAHDALLQRLVAELDRRAAWSFASLLVVSDHGMASATKALNPHGPLDAAGIDARLEVRNGSVSVFLEDPADAERALAALSALEHAQAYRRESIPAELRYRHPTRTGDLVLLTGPPYFFASSSAKQVIEGAARRLVGGERGGHGYAPEHDDMGGIFYAMGRGVSPRTELGDVRAIDVAPTIAHLLGIEPPRQSEGAPMEALSRSR